MRPEFLPPLVIPAKKTPEPVLLAIQRPPGQQDHRRQVEQPRRQYQAWKTHSPLFRVPVPQYESEPGSDEPDEPDEPDDLALFQFHHPCLLPPPSIPTTPTRVDQRQRQRQAGAETGHSPTRRRRGRGRAHSVFSHVPAPVACIIAMPFPIPTAAAAATDYDCHQRWDPSKPARGGRQHGYWHGHH
ncbi:hypothetical protein MMYC01_203390 [Madurella mycetomatis]|uniref:Uncharacterized protein n=1 Tax=Madurella mycetomatis TaxID=100816 RepID=A0A175WAS2_9PEZI|nr:hypothetical protein MMYC01_203390 [Madurella mycetomatis]